MRTQSEICDHNWFGRLPKEWKLRPMGSLFSFSKGITLTKADLTEDGARVINYGQIHSKANTGTKITADLIRHISSDKIPFNVQPARKGSFIFACTSEDLQGCGNCIYIDSKIEVYAGGDTILLSPLNKCEENKYLAYQFLTDAWRFQIRRELVDVKVFHVNKENLKEAYVVLPPAEVQRSIVSFLDARCIPINEAITRHRQAIEKLEEYRRSVVAQSVIKGLSTAVPMKNSGISWIGNIPSQWQLTKIKYVANVMSGATPKKSIAEYWDGEIPFVTPADFSTKDHYISKGGNFITKAGMYSCSTSLLPSGSVIVSTRAPIGPVVINTAPICTNQGCKGLVPRDKDFNFEYLYLVLSVAEEALNALGNGTTYLELSKNSLSNFIIPRPPLKEQNDIVSYVEKHCEPLDKAISSHQLSIQKLKEFRRSLIHAAVTGRIDCTKETL